MKVTRCVWQYHDKKDDLEPVFNYFRYCANEAIRIGIEKNLSSKYNLYYQLYHKLRLDSKFHSKYVCGALECAASKLKLYKKTLKKKPHAKKPYISRNHLIINNQSYKIEQDIIRIPTEPAKYLFIRLTRYVCEKIKGAKIGNIVITDDKIILSYSRDVIEQRPSNFVGIDRNLNNVTTCDFNRICIVHDLSKAQRIVSSYGIVKSKLRRNDSRKKKDISKIWKITEK